MLCVLAVTSSMGRVHKVLDAYATSYRTGRSPTTGPEQKSYGVPQDLAVVNIDYLKTRYHVDVMNTSVLPDLLTML
ncbi:unnamed protein product [Toxocara canis]|uniref:Neur_chan_LBD domain-containing protein n=1 Tax=Toxocara canis TaxID=6265 RepID=A0A183U4T1_TOXCA|nr:unnamed protein product [Toxocara canis]